MFNHRNAARGPRRIEVGLEAGGPDLLVVFRLWNDEELVGQLTAWPSEVGLPESWSEARQRDDSGYRLPDPIVAALREFLREAPPDEPLWIGLSGARGYLPLVPWERLLWPELGRPLLRRPGPTRSTLEVVLCLSSPKPRLRIDPGLVVSEVMTGILFDLTRPFRFHVFADAELRDEFRQRVRNLANLVEVRVYDPPVESDPSPTKGSTIASPWLLWVARELQGRTVDAVHFVGHGVLGHDGGALVLAESPSANVGPEAARPVQGIEIAAFLDGIRPWATAFSSPPGNDSMGGLRSLQDRLAELRPGPSLLHDLAHSQGGADLLRGYEFLFGDRETGPPASSAITLYGPPPILHNSKRVDLARVSPQLECAASWDLEWPPSDVDLATRLAWGWKSPEWTDLQRAPGSPIAQQDAIESGRAKALLFVSEALARHAPGSGRKDA